MPPRMGVPERFKRLVPAAVREKSFLDFDFLSLWRLRMEKPFN